MANHKQHLNLSESTIERGSKGPTSATYDADGNKDDDSSNLTGLDSLSAFIKSQATERTGRGIPPLEKWSPKRSGEMDLLIKANGEWWHEGSKITRDSLVTLFSSILWSEHSSVQDGDRQRQYYLKTPVEKIRIQVEDVPFLINDVNIVTKDGVQWLEFVTKTGDVIYLDQDHQLSMETYQGEMRPYIPVRFGMKGLVARSVLMYLTQIGTLNSKAGQTILSLQSGGHTYEVAVDNEDQ